MKRIKNHSWLLLGLYYCIGIMYLLLYYTGVSFGPFISQPLFMPVLILYYFTRIRSDHVPVDKWVILAVFFSWLGDLSMMFIELYKIMVLPGIISFLLMHLTYIGMFYQKGALKRVLSARLVLIVILIAVAAGLYMYLYPNFTGEKEMFKIPVLIYTGIILTMVVIASLRDAGKKDTYRLVLLGALCFLFSDATLSIQIFQGPYLKIWIAEHPVFLSWAVVGITYTSAQVLIVEGLIRSKNKLK